MADKVRSAFENALARGREWKATDVALSAHGMLGGPALGQTLARNVLYSLKAEGRLPQEREAKVLQGLAKLLSTQEHGHRVVLHLANAAAVSIACVTHPQAQ